MAVDLTTAPEAFDEAWSIVVATRRQALRPPPRLTVPEWADEFRNLPKESGSTGGKWQTSRVEVARGPMMAVTEPGVRTITVKCCTQLMKTALLENVFGYFAHLDPSPMLLVQPKDEAVEAFSKERIAPMIQATPVLKALMGDQRTRKSDDTIKFKKFPGGFLAMVAAGSPTNLAMRAIRVTLLDEIDKYESTKEGDTVALAEERSATFPTNSLALRVCSPTIEGASRISSSYEASDERRAYVACPHCDHRQVLDFFKHVHWDKTDDGQHKPETARVYCEGCGAGWTEAERLKALRTMRHFQTKKFTCCDIKQDPQVTRSWRWDERLQVGRATCTECGTDAVSNRHAGFHASKMYSPWKDMADLARKWVEAKDDPETRKTFYNTQLGLEYRPEAGKFISNEDLLARREAYDGEVPSGVALLTAGIDTQTDRLELEVVGWGRDEESWSIDTIVLQGDPSSPEVWQALDRVLLKKYRRADGREFGIEAACLDTGGHHTQMAYTFAKERLGRRVWGIKGASDSAGKNSPVWPSAKPKKNKSRYRPYIIGVNAAKDIIRGRLHTKLVGPGYCHFPADRDAAWFDQLLAERYEISRVRGHQVRRWVQIKGRANEALDCRVYAYAAMCGLVHLGWKLNRIANQVDAAVTPTRSETEEVNVTSEVAEVDEPVPAYLKHPAAKKPAFAFRRGVSRSRFMG